MEKFDTVEGIKEYLTDLDGLHRLVQDRWKYYDAGEKLTPFVLFQKLSLDNCGQIGSADVTVHCNDIITVEDIHESDNIWISSRPCIFVPSSTDKCKLCGTGWTLRNCYDCTKTYKGGLFHNKCLELFTIQNTQKYFRKIFDDIGQQRAELVLIPNQYWDDPEPWILATIDGVVIRIGWRKRVISISWDKPLEGLFLNEDVTKGSTYIHAWGEEKCKEYLAVILERLTKCH